MDEFFKLFEKRLEKLFLALVGITWVKDTSVIEKESEKGGNAIYFLNHFSSIFHQKVYQKIDAKTDTEKT